MAYASANAGWSIGGQIPNLRTGVIHGGRSIGPTLPSVGAGFGKVPEVVDHAGTDKGAAFAVKCNAPWITRALAKDLKLTSLCMNTKHRTCKIKAFFFCSIVLGLKTPLSPYSQPSGPHVSEFGSSFVSNRPHPVTTTSRVSALPSLSVS